MFQAAFIRRVVLRNFGRIVREANITIEGSPS